MKLRKRTAPARSSQRAMNAAAARLPKPPKALAGCRPPAIASLLLPVRWTPTEVFEERKRKNVSTKKTRTQNFETFERF